MKKVLTIAGSDPSGGAGIQADLKTILAHGMYGMSAITALTAQNTTGVYGVLDCTPEFLRQQLDCVFQDIFPDSVKIGMVSSGLLAGAIADALEQYRPAHVVLDTVMISTSGHRLLLEDAVRILTERLMPMAEVITPNLPEAEALLGRDIAGRDARGQAAAELAGELGCGVLLKGGHLRETAEDVLAWKGELFYFPGERVDCPNNHGTGCTLSSAIACNLAAGYALPESVQRAKEYVTGALLAGLDLGAGCGPIDHGYALSRRDEIGGKR